MAEPWIFQSTFEQGTNGEWDSETDTASQLDFPSYTDLARFSKQAPFRGAFVMRADLSGGTADAFVQEGDIDIASAANRFFRFYIMFSMDFTGTADDTAFNIFEIQDTSNVVEGTFGARYTNSTDVINFGIGEVTPTSFSGDAVERGVWYAIELDITLDNAGNNDGTIDLYVTKEGDAASTAVAATQVASLDQGAITHGILGIGLHASTTTGQILFDQFVMDDARIYPITDRWTDTVTITRSQHIFVGPGQISRATLQSGANAGDTLRLYDTDVGNVLDRSKLKDTLKNLTAEEVVRADTPTTFTRGCYAELTSVATPDDSLAVLQVGRCMTLSTAAIRDFGLGNHIR